MNTSLHTHHIHIHAKHTRALTNIYIDIFEFKADDVRGSGTGNFRFEPKKTWVYNK